MKYLIHPAEERKSRNPEQSKEEALQGSSSATTSMINPRRCPKKNAMSLLNVSSPRVMALSSRISTKETHTIREIPIRNK